MKRITLTITVDVPDWATHVAVDGDGQPVALHARRNGVKVGIHADRYSESWYGGMTHALRVVDWDKTRRSVCANT